MLNLYPYQQKAVAAVNEQLDDGNATMLQLATGGGKTEIAMSLIQDQLDAGKRVFFVPHRKELVANAVKRAQKYGLRPYNIYEDGWHWIYTSHPNLYVQSIMKLHNRFKEGMPVGAPDLVILDEAHHATSRTWSNTINWLKAQETRILGLTATPWRLTKTEGFDHIFDSLVTTPQTRQLMEEGYLSDVRFSINGHDGITRELNRVTLTGGDYNSAALENTIGSALITDPFHAWVEQCKDKHKTLIFAANRRAAIKIAMLIRQAGGKPGVFITNADRAGTGDSIFQELNRQAKAAGIPMAGWGDTQRDKVFADFERGELDTLVNVTILTEGIDVPDVSAVILGRPTKSLVLQRQMIGRGLRVAPDKEHLLIIDTAGVITEPEIGNPLNEYQWNLYPRGAKGEGEAPPLPVCGAGLEPDWETQRLPGCGAEIHPSVRHCKLCGLSNGSICPGCREWKSQWRGGVHCELPHDDGHSCADVASNYSMTVAEFMEWEQDALENPDVAIEMDMADIPLCGKCKAGFLLKVESALNTLYEEQEEEPVPYHYDGLVRWWAGDWIKRTFNVPLKDKRYMIITDEDQLQAGFVVSDGILDTGKRGIKYFDAYVVATGIKTNRGNAVAILDASKLRKDKLNTTIANSIPTFTFNGYYRQRRWG